jgi:hypothetical protein
MGPVLAATAALAAAVAAAPAATTAASVPLEFDRAQLGMSLADWRSLPPPPGVGPTTVPTCAPVSGVAAVQGVALGVRTTRTDLVSCSYDTRFGHYALAHTIRLDALYRASHVQYLFAAERLVEIRFMASVDAFNDLDALFTQRYGPPVRVVRDKVPNRVGPLQRVRETWRTPQGWVFLTDPAGDDVQISVRMVASDARSGLAS